MVWDGNSAGLGRCGMRTAAAGKISQIPSGAGQF